MAQFIKQEYNPNPTPHRQNPDLTLQDSSMERAPVTKTKAGTILPCTAMLIDPVNMPDLIRIQSGSAQKLQAEAGLAIIAQWLVSRLDPSSQNLT